MRLAVLLLASLPAVGIPLPLVSAAETQGPESPPEAASTRAPLPPPGEMARLKALIDAGQIAAARSRLEPIVEAHPAWARASLLLASTYYKEHRFEAAAGWFAKALAADPQEIAIRPPYGWTLYALGEIDEAAAMFESLLEAKPDYPSAHYALGVIALDRDEVDRARERFETTVRLAAQQGDPPMAGRAHARLGDLYVRLDDLAAARRELELAVELAPDEHEALFKLSRVLQRLGDEAGADEARKRFEAARAPVRPGIAPPPGGARGRG